MKTKAGIWQGRFQPVHKGHVTMFERELLNFDEQFIAIVNPCPSYPPVEGFDNFSLNNNPFSYFQRMLIWKYIIDDNNLKKNEGDKIASVTFIPCWHARKYVALENEFLPDKANRAWIIPVDRDCTEEQKAKDLDTHGENIYNVECDKTCNNITATYIRHHIGDSDIEEMMPRCTIDITRKLLNGITPGTYYIVPFVGDKFDIYSIQYAINKTKDENSHIVFALTVKVDPNGADRWSDENNLPWWFRQADHTDPKNDISFYQKSLMINRLMEKLGLTNYYITPLFVKGDSLSGLSDYNNAFLPPQAQSTWTVNSSIQYLYGLSNYLRNIGAKKTTIEKSEKIDSTLLDFFSDDNIEFIYNNADNLIVTRLRSNISIYKQCLIEWVASNTPGAQDHLTTVIGLESKYGGEMAIPPAEVLADNATLDKIINWINNNRMAG